MFSLCSVCYQCSMLKLRCSQFTFTQTQAMVTIRLALLILLAAFPVLNAAPGPPRIDLSDSFEIVADSDIDALTESTSEEDDEQVPLMPKPQQDFNLADHIKPKKGEKNVIGGKFKCDSNGCQAVDEEVFDESL